MAMPPWQALRAHLRERHYEEFFGGALYLLVGEKPRSELAGA